MSKKQKLIERLQSKPKNMTFDELETALSALGYYRSNKGKTSGSRVKFFGNGADIVIHKPHPRKEIKPYQIEQILEILESEDLI